MRRVSLTTLILLMTIAALAVALLSVTWRLRATETRLMHSEDRRFDSWPEPNSVGVLALPGSDQGFRPAVNHAVFDWKVQLPNTRRYELHWEAIGAKASSGVASPRLPSGQSVLSITLLALDGNAVSLSWGAEPLVTKKQLMQSRQAWSSLQRSDAQQTLRLDQAGHLFNLPGYQVWIAGLHDTESGDASAPFTLLEVVEPSVEGDKTRRFRLWIEPVPASEPREEPAE